MNVQKKSLFSFVLAVSALPLVPCWAEGETQTWSAEPANGAWSVTAANWEGGCVWSPGNLARFADSAVKAIAVDEQVVVSNLVFDADGYVLSGSGSVVSPQHSRAGAATTVGSGYGGMTVEVADGANVVCDVPLTNAYGSAFAKTGAGSFTLTGGGYLFTVRPIGSGLFAISNCTLVTAKFFKSTDGGEPRLHFDGATLRPANQNQILGMTGNVFEQATVGKGGLTFGAASGENVKQEELSQSLTPAPELGEGETDGGLALDAPYALLVNSPATTLKGGLDIRRGKVLLASAGGIGSGPVTVNGDFYVTKSMALTNDFLFGAGKVGVTAAEDGLVLSSIGFAPENAAKTIRLDAQAEGGTVRIASDAESPTIGSFALSGGVTLLADGDTFTADGSAEPFAYGTGTLRVGNGGVTFDTAGHDISLGAPMTFDGARVATNEFVTTCEVSGGSFETGTSGWSFTKGKNSSGDNSVQANGSAFAKSGTTQYDTPDGMRFAVVRSGTGSCVTLPFTVPSDGEWSVTFEQAYRPGIGGGENLQYAVYLDYGKPTQMTLRDFAADGRMHGFELRRLDPVALSAGTSHTLTFMAGEPQDTTQHKYDCLLIDAVRLEQVERTYEDVPVGAFVKKGAGALSLNGPVFTGAVSVEGGTLAVGNVAFRSNVVTVAAGGTVKLASVGTVSVPNADFETETVAWGTGSLSGWSTMPGTALGSIGSQANKGTVSANGPYTTAEGPHTAIIRLRSGIQTTIRASHAGTYEFAFDSAPRWKCGTAGYSIAVTALVDNVAVAYVPGRAADGGEFQTTRVLVSLTAGDHTLAFHTDNADGTANITDGPMMFIDNIRFTSLESGFADDGATWHFARGATIDVGPYGAELNKVYVDGTCVQGSKSAFTAAGLNVLGSGKLHSGPPQGLLILVR